MRAILFFIIVTWFGTIPFAFAQQLKQTKTAKVQVTVFLSTECPVSQQYVPRLRELYQEFSGKNISFTAFFPLSTDDYKAIGRFRRDYSLPFPTKPDPSQQTARRFRASITPEVVVQDSNGSVVYQGAIDDWFVSLGKHRPEPSQHYLRNALLALLNNQPILPARTEAVGCYIE